jgi:ribonuclease HII
MERFSYEEELFRAGFRSVCGMDEVGRGALFGPVVSGAVILDPLRLHPGIDDSKKLSPAKRLEMAAFIYRHALACSIGWRWNDEIDQENILQATYAAMAMALRKLPLRPDCLLIDAIDPARFGMPGRGVIHGDRLSLSIAAASIIAKVFRDQLVSAMSPHFPEYDLGRNKGYPTQHHQNMILCQGRTPYHRASYKLRCLLNRD